MLEKYFVKPQTVDRVRASWIGPEIERYVGWLAEHRYAARCVFFRVPLLVAFGEFAWARGARVPGDLPAHVESFVAQRVKRFAPRRTNGRYVAREVRGPIEQALTVVLPDYQGRARARRPLPFAVSLPGFFEYLAAERGLRPATIEHYRHQLGRFEAYLLRIDVAGVGDLSPIILSAYVAERSGAGLSKENVLQTCGVLRVFLRYAHREGAIASDLSPTVEWPQVYRLSSIPRSISWTQLGEVLACVDRRTPAGKRDYAILLLLSTYGLRGREVTALTLDDIDWRHERLAIPERKAGHCTAFPLSAAVGEALVDYLKHGRPQSADRHVFFRVTAPCRPITCAAVSQCARRYLLAAGVEAPRLGSHTLRHSCVQRLVDSEFALKTIGDFIGHRSAASTEIYAKVAIEPLREVAVGDGEEVLR